MRQEIDESSSASRRLRRAEKLLDAAVHVIRSKGYSAARVEDICAEAGLTKGAFFHHFAKQGSLRDRRGGAFRRQRRRDL